MLPITDAIVEAASAVCRRLSAALLVVATHSGRTALALSKQRNASPTLALTDNPETDGAYPYKRDLPKVEFHLIDTGHFALEDKADEMVPLIRDFLDRKLAPR